MADRDREARILELARSVPAGFVTSYGDLCPEAPRLAGTVLAACDDPALPWHRIVRADGSLAKGERQRRLLEREGVPFSGARVRVELAHLPREALADSPYRGVTERAGGLSPGACGRRASRPRPG